MSSMPTTQLEPEQGHRERKKAATRHALQRAALVLAAEHGVDRMTVEAISEAADVSPRTFFNYFSSKEEALAGDPPALDDRLRTALATAGPRSSLVSIMRAVVVEAALEAADRRDELLLRKQLVQDHPVLLPRLLGAFAVRERALIDAIADHLGADTDEDIYPVLLAAISATAFRVAFWRWDGGEKNQLEQLVNQAFDLLERGL